MAATFWGQAFCVALVEGCPQPPGDQGPGPLLCLPCSPQQVQCICSTLAELGGTAGRMVVLLAMGRIGLLVQFCQVRSWTRGQGEHKGLEGSAVLSLERSNVTVPGWFS